VTILAAMTSPTAHRDAIAVFLSYARQDTAIVDRMAADLAERGFEVRLDRRNLPYGEEWQNELAELIKGCDTVVWLASRSSIASRWCNWELGECQRNNKRLIPVRIDDVKPENFPEALGRFHSLPATGIYDPDVHLGDLVDALNADRDWIKQHTRLADRAAEWVGRGRPADRLLRGRALAEAENWRDRRSATAPPPSGETLDLILESKRKAAQNLRRLAAFAVAIAVTMAALAVVAALQWNTASSERIRAETQAEIADVQREVAVGRLELRDNPIPALRRIADAAERNRNGAQKGRFESLSDVHAGLFEALDSGRELPRLRGFHDGLYMGVFAMAEEPSWRGFTDRFLIGTREEVLLADGKGRLLAPPIAGPDLGPAYANAIAWLGSRDKPGFAVATGEGFDQERWNIGVTLYDNAGRELDRHLTGNAEPIISLAYMEQRKLLLAGDMAGNLYRIDIQARTVEKISEGAGKALIGIAVPTYPNDTIVLAYGTSDAVTYSQSNNAASPAVTFGQTESLNLAGRIGISAFRAFAMGTAGGLDVKCLGGSNIPWSTDTVVFSCEERGGVSIWESPYDAAWPPFAATTHIRVDGGTATAVAYSVALRAIAVGDQNGGIQLFTLQGTPLTPVLRQRSGAVVALTFVDGGKTLWSFSMNDTSIRRWGMSEIGGYARQMNDLSASTMAISPHGRFRVFSEDHYRKGKNIVVMDTQNWARPEIRRFPLTMDVVPLGMPLAVSANGSRAAWVDANAVVFANVSSKAEPTRLPLPAEAKVRMLALSHDGDHALAVFEPGEKKSDSGGLPVKTPSLVRLYAFATSGEATLVKEWQDLPEAAITALISAPPRVSLDQGKSHPLFITGDELGGLAAWDAEGTRIFSGKAAELSDQMAVSQFAMSANAEKLLIVLLPTSQVGTPAFLSRIALWSLSSWSPVTDPLNLPRKAEAIGLNSDGSLAAISGKVGLLGQALWDMRIFDTKGFRLLETVPIPEELDGTAHLWFDGKNAVWTLDRFMVEKTWAADPDALLAMARTRLTDWERSDRYDALMREGETQASRKEWDLSLKTFQKAAAMRDDVFGPWMRIGNQAYNATKGTGDKALALAAYDKAIKADPYDILGHARRGRLRYFLGDFAGAEQDYREATHLPMTYMRVTKIIAGMLEINRSLRKMSEIWRRDSRYEVFAFLAYSLFAQKKWAEAEAAFDQIIIHQGRGSAMDRELRARSRIELGKIDGALDDFAVAIEELNRSNGGYSGLDDFMGIGDTAEKRSYKICEIAGLAETSITSANLQEAKKDVRLKMLKAGVEACGKAWMLQPSLFPDSQERLLAAQKQLVALDAAAPLPSEMTMPVSELWRKLEGSAKAEDIEVFRKRFSASSEAALAGRLLARVASPGAKPAPDAIAGTWQNENVKIKIESDGNGGQIWRNLNPKDTSFAIGDVISETHDHDKDGWSHIGRHKWDASPGGAPKWGMVDHLVVTMISADALFYAYLDSRYTGGWVLRRVSDD
jgi:tetratricopeptide (TPR) repeat protein